MVDVEDDHRDTAEIHVKERMDDIQTHNELVPSEQNNDERNVR